jgi:hypothetical protein
MTNLVKFSDLDDADDDALDVERAYLPRHWEVDPIYYQNRQWAVTRYGIENVAGPYHYYISKADFKKQMGSGEYGWPHHMAGKNWVDQPAFLDAFERACERFGSGGAK